MHENLMEKVISSENYGKALRAVEKNAGASGVDGMSTKQIGKHLETCWTILSDKMLKGTYKPCPVRQVDIPKPNGGTRRLGIPTVQDRFIQQLLLQVLSPIFDATFSDHSYGFRPRRDAHQAIKAMQRYAQEGKDWVVDFDISQFFDKVHHDILMSRVGSKIRDKRILKLVGSYLRTGAMVGGVMQRSEKGTPQGGPLSPLLANIYLDALDKELEKRGHSFCRYADDCNIYVGSETAAKRVSENIHSWIKKYLRLEINEQKSDTGRVWERKFLGFRLNRSLEIEVASKSISGFKNSVRRLWRSCQSQSSLGLKTQWRAYLVGWWNYFRLAEKRDNLQRLSGWIRRHMRKCFWLRWHDYRGRYNKLRSLGLRGRRLKVASSSRGAWRIAKSPSLHAALSNAVLKQYGFLTLQDLTV